MKFKGINHPKDGDLRTLRRDTMQSFTKNPRLTCLEFSENDLLFDEAMECPLKY